MPEIIRVTELVKRYKELVALDHLNMSVEGREIFGLLGPNGSKKINSYKLHSVTASSMTAVRF